MNSKDLTEQDICSKIVLPAIVSSDWDLHQQIREQKTFTDGRITLHGKTVSRGEKKRADFILYHKNNLPIAVVEAKDGNHTVGAGLEQAKQYAEILHIPFAYSTNGAGFIEYDFFTGLIREITTDNFPSPSELFARYIAGKNLDSEQTSIINQEYYTDGSGRSPRYYQQVAINEVVESVAKGQNRILLVMATGTGKTYTSFQIIYRLWKSGAKKRILFLVDRTALAQQTMTGDFKHFGSAMTRIKNGTTNKAYEIYVALYQGLTGNTREDDPEAIDEQRKLFQDFPADFFDLIVVDECHRGGIHADSAWREILDYYTSATQIGMTATPKETHDTSTMEYFGKPVYTYSLKQGIDDGFLAPYKVIRYRFNYDKWRPPMGFVDKDGDIVPDEIFTENMFDRSIIIEDRNRAVAKCIADFMRETDPYQKTIVFCVDIAHADRMRTYLANEMLEFSRENPRYVVKITGDDTFGKMEIENFIDPESRYPVIATTSKLLSTGVDTKMVKLVVLDSPMNSMTEFKQIIGRGTRVEEQYGKYYFTIMDFRDVTRLFADKGFDGDPVQVFDGTNDKSVDPQEFNESGTLSESELRELDPSLEILIDGTNPEKPKKIHIREGVNFYPIIGEVKYIDPLTGKLITESLTDYSRKMITGQYATLDEFLTTWRESDRKSVIIAELAERGVIFEELRSQVGAELDAFDLILHVAYGKKPLTRRQRAINAKKNDYFTKYQGTAREIIEILFDQYTREGITAIDEIRDLSVPIFSPYGASPMEIIQTHFESRDQYLEIINTMQSALYSE
jgi:type I restriction enzyme R subunit